MGQSHARSKMLGLFSSEGPQKQLQMTSHLQCQLLGHLTKIIKSFRGRPLMIWGAEEIEKKKNQPKNVFEALLRGKNSEGRFPGKKLSIYLGDFAILVPFGPNFN